MGNLTVNFSVLKFSGWDMVVEHKVDLAEAAVLGFGKTEPAPDIAEEVGTGVEEACFGSPVPG
jgi:hypothetical protein